MPRKLEEINADLASVRAKMAGAAVVWTDMGNIIDAGRMEQVRLEQERVAAEKGEDLPSDVGLGELVIKGEAHLKGKLTDIGKDAKA